MARKVKTTETGQEKSILSALKEIVKSDTEMYWILWKYAPELLNKKVNSFDELKEAYVAFADRTEEQCEKYIYREDVQAGIKYVLRSMDTKRDIELYNKYYELSMSGDVQALKAYMSFKKSFFSDGSADELTRLLKNAPSSVNDDDIADFVMEF